MAKASLNSSFIRRSAKDIVNPNPIKGLKAIHNPKGPVEFRSGKSQKARQTAQKQEQQIATQKQREDLRKADAEDKIGRKKQLARNKTAGRSLLTATSPTGTTRLG